MQKSASSAHEFKRVQAEVCKKVQNVCQNENKRVKLQATRFETTWFVNFQFKLVTREGAAGSSVKDAQLSYFFAISVLTSGGLHGPLTPIPVKSIAIHLPFLSRCFCKCMPSSSQKVAHAQPICITIRLAFGSRCFCRSIRVRGRWSHLGVDVKVDKTKFRIPIRPPTPTSGDFPSDSGWEKWILTKDT